MIRDHLLRWTQSGCSCKGVDKGGGGGGLGGLKPPHFLRFPSLIINHQFSIHEFYLKFPNINIRLWLRDTTHLLFCSSQDHLVHMQNHAPVKVSLGTGCTYATRMLLYAAALKLLLTHSICCRHNEDQLYYLHYITEAFSLHLT